MSSFSERVLVTGGAGFIGSHLVDALLSRGHPVRVLDNLEPQAHPTGRARHLAQEAELMEGDLRDPHAVARALQGVALVYHLGGMVGNGQSMLEVRHYIDANAVGTATLLQQICASRNRIRRLIVASSMVVYGDGAYACAEHGAVCRVARPESRLVRRLWEPTCPHCGEAVEPIALTEEQQLQPNSVYGISKRDQEELCLVLGRAHGIPTIALRYLCTYGSRQALDNPYTGVAAIWASRLLNGHRPLVFEDGRQLRDFIHVSDVVAANLAAAEAPERADFHAFNIGSGTRYTVEELARVLTRALGSDLAPELSSEYRTGDIRHCFADISRARSELGFQPRVSLEQGITEFAEWAASERPIDRSEAANAELRTRGVIR